MMICVFQLFVDDRDVDAVAVTRHNPTSHQSVILVARTAFSYPHHYGHIPNLKIEGTVILLIISSPALQNFTFFNL